MYNRFLKPLTGSYFLFGPRGTGKTTWLKTHYPDALWIDLLDSEQVIYFSAYPSRLREKILAHPEKKIVVIDEIQKIPDLLSEIHRLIEEKRGIQFIMTGSSMRKLKRNKDVNLLGGRAQLLSMPPFFAAELGADFSLVQALRVGLVPLIATAQDPGPILRAYAALYLKEEVQAEALVRDIGEFARFLEVISFSHASLLNVSNIANESSVNRKTVENYLQILYDMFLAFPLNVFRRRAKRDLATHNKFYFFDAGVFRFFRPTGRLDIPEELEGPALEGLVAQHLRAWCEEQKSPVNLFFWRTKTQLEVDFVIDCEHGFWAIEVKNGREVNPSDLRGLKAFKVDYPEATAILLYRGKHRLQKDDVLCLPVDEFLLGIAPDRPIWTF